MCDFSLQQVKSRPAAVGDKLVTRDFGTGTRGFAGCADGENDTAICLLPGTELAFGDDISCGGWFSSGYHHHSQDTRVQPHRTAIFRQINKEHDRMHHDAIELPDGEIMLLNLLTIGQRATVLQLPAVPRNEAEEQEQKRLEVVG